MGKGRDKRKKVLAKQKARQAAEAWLGGRRRPGSRSAPSVLLKTDCHAINASAKKEEDEPSSAALPLSVTCLKWQYQQRHWRLALSTATTMKTPISGIAANITHEQEQEQEHDRYHYREQEQTQEHQREQAALPLGVHSYFCYKACPLRAQARRPLM